MAAFSGNASVWSCGFSALGKSGAGSSEREDTVRDKVVQEQGTMTEERENVGAPGEHEGAKKRYTAPVLVDLRDLRDITLGATPAGNESGGGGDFSVIEPGSPGSSTDFESGATESRSERSSSSDSRR